MIVYLNNFNIQNSAISNSVNPIILSQAAKFNSMWFSPVCVIKQSGAVEACWAHNPEVGGSKPLSASNFVFVTQHLIEHHCLANLLPIPY